MGRLLVLLACLPLVLPAQVCLCHAHTTPPTPVEITPTPAPVPVKASCCSHKKAQHQHPPVSVPEKSSLNESHTPVEPIHEPYCPISQGVEPVTAIDSGIVVLVALVLGEAFLIPENHLAIPPPDFVTPVCIVSACPLFVSHCRFNI